MIDEECEDGHLLMAVTFLGDYDILLGRLEICWRQEGAELVIINNSDNFAGVKITFDSKYIHSFISY